MASSHLLQRVDITTSTKHSMQVVWSVPEDSLMQVRGFQVHYQAVGSHVVQYSRILSSSTFSHYITRLHENTAYNVCVNVLTADQDTTTTKMEWSSNVEALVGDDNSGSCVTGSTAIDALRLALGSTLGAFIALAIVVAFVLLAKCQHRRRVRRIRRRRHRRSSEKSQPLTDSDNVSFFDYYDDEYGSVCNDDRHNDQLVTAMTTDFCPGSPPSHYDKTQLIFNDQFTATDSGNVVCRERSDKNAELYGVTSDAEADKAAARTTEFNVACPAVFVPDDETGQRPVNGQGFRVSPNSTLSPRCFTFEDDFKATVGPKSEVLRLTETYTQPADSSIFDIMPTDTCDKTELLCVSDSEWTPGGLKPNHYSSIW